MDLLKIGSFIASLRKERALTQAQLAEKLGVTNKTISRWENGNYLPSTEMLKLLSEEFDVTINELLSGERTEVCESKPETGENSKKVVSSSTFTLREKRDFWNKKWYKENFFFLVCDFLIYIFCLTYGSIKSNIKLLIFAYVFAVAVCLINYNRKMAYIEKHIF